MLLGVLIDHYVLEFFCPKHNLLLFLAFIIESSVLTCVEIVAKLLLVAYFSQLEAVHLSFDLSQDPWIVIMSPFVPEHVLGDTLDLFEAESFPV